MIVTKHGKKRIKERLGLPKRAHLKHIKKVLENGVVYIKRGYKELQVIYNGFLYIFAYSDKREYIFVTTFRDEELDLFRG
jgi:hypothetical protein